MQLLKSTRGLVHYFVMAIALIPLAGCGGGGGGESSNSDPSGNATSSSEQNNSGGTGSGQQSNGNTVTQGNSVNAVDPNRKETKWIGTVPYDVFYDRPWEIASDSTVLPGTTPTSLTNNNASPGTQLNQGTMPTPAGGDPKPEAGGGDKVEWDKLITAEILNTEVKVVRTRLTTKLQSLSTYNQDTKAISNDGAYLAGLAAVAERHAGDISWKENAKFVRDLAYQIYSNADGTGRTAFTATQLPFEQLCTVLDGGPPPDDLEAEANAAFGDVAYLDELMKWIEPNFTAIKANVNTESRMKEDPETLERQLRALLVVGRMMGDSSYANAEEAKYQGFVNDFVGGIDESIQAAKSGSFDSFQAGLNKVQNSCAECHPPYRGGDAGF
ncbi:MAG: hypothetical protein KDA69_08185 [Planctomycetaceae bacterium]|nr:hypothetical protein [Planctomycetaceae bacterium]